MDPTDSFGMMNFMNEDAITMPKVKINKNYLKLRLNKILKIDERKLKKTHPVHPINYLSITKTVTCN